MAMNILFLGQLVNGEPQQLTYANSLDFFVDHEDEPDGHPAEDRFASLDDFLDPCEASNGELAQH